MNVHACESSCVYYQGGSAAAEQLEHVCDLSGKRQAGPTSSLFRLATLLQTVEAVALSVELLVLELCAAP